MSHTRSKAVAAAIGVLLIATSVTAKDNPKDNFTNPGTDLAFQNCTSSGKFSFVATTTSSLLAVQLKRLQALTDTDQTPCSPDDYICILDVTAHFGGIPLPVSLIARAEVNNGQIRIKRDFCRENPMLCAPPVIPVTAADMRCYAPDAGYSPAITFTGITGCDGVVVGGASNPSSALIARTGISAGCQ